jgi:GDSL-like Lipase/Acylhydrolase family
MRESRCAGDCFQGAFSFALAMPFDLPFDYLLGMTGWLAALAGALVGLLRWRRQLRSGRNAGAIRRAQRKWSNLGLSLWMFLAMLTLVELYFAVIYDQSDAFNMTNVSKHWFERHVAPVQKVLRFRDGQGTIYRDDRPFLTKVAETQHPICFVGDSFTFGHGVARCADRFSDRVAASLEQKFPGRFVVSNLADAGRDPHWIEALLLALAKDELPVRTVVYTICLNDIETFDERTEEMYKKKPPWMSQLFLVRNTYFLNLLYSRIRHASSSEGGGYYSFLEESYSGPPWTKMRSKLDTIRQLCVQHGFDLRIVIFPFLSDFGAEYPFVEAHRLIVEFCRETGIPVLDLGPVLLPRASEGLTVNRFDAHPNERAHAIAAEAIERKLLGDLTGR